MQLRAKLMRCWAARLNNKSHFIVLLFVCFLEDNDNDLSSFYFSHKINFFGIIIEEQRLSHTALYKILNLYREQYQSVFP